MTIDLPMEMKLIYHKITDLSHSTAYALDGGTTNTARKTKAQFGPQGDYKGSMIRNHGLGYAWINSNQGMVLRGGYLGSKTRSGVFAVGLGTSTIALGKHNGFRCAYHPPSPSGGI